LTDPVGRKFLLAAGACVRAACRMLRAHSRGPARVVAAVPPGVWGGQGRAESSYPRGAAWEPMEIADWIVAVVERFGYLGVALLTAAENLFPPLPSEVVLPLVGFAVSKGVLTLAGAVAAATLGAVAGAVALYWIGAAVGMARVRAFVQRRGRWLLLDAEDVDRSEGWFRRNSAWAVLVGRLVPGVRSVVSLPAGAARMPLGSFLLLTTAGSAVWSAALVGLGYILGAQWERVSAWVDRVGMVVWAAIALAVLVVLVRRASQRRETRGRRT